MFTFYLFFQAKLFLIFNILKRSNGNSFEIETSGFDSGNLHTGDVVTFTYESISKLGYPVGANLQRIRKDITWKQVADPHISTPTTSMQFLLNIVLLH
jgi:hypothetical protein